MLSITEELRQFKQERKRRYIAIYELLDYLKSKNQDASYSEISQWLLIRLVPNDPRRADNVDWNYWNLNYKIPVYELPKTINEPVNEIDELIFFYILESVKNVTEPMLFDPPLTSARDIIIHATTLNIKNDLYIERDQIETLLKIKLPLGDTKTELEEQIADIGINECLAFTDTINQQREEIARLKAELEKREESTTETDEKKGRVSTPQKALIALLIHKNYADYPTLNKALNAINIELANIGYSNEISYNTIKAILDDTQNLNYNSPNKAK